jgi:hypothetical protein
LEIENSLEAIERVEKAMEEACRIADEERVKRLNGKEDKKNGVKEKKYAQ